MIAVSILSTGCVGSSSSSSTNDDTVYPDILARATPTISLDHLGVLPVTPQGEDNPTYYMQIHNNSSQEYTIKSINVTTLDTNQSAQHLVQATTDVGSTISTKQSVDIKLVPQIKTSGNALLNVVVSDSKGNDLTLRQIIRMSADIYGSGGIVARNDILKIAATDGYVGLAIPMILSQDFDKITPLAKIINSKDKTQTIKCKNEHYNKGNSCTLLINQEIYAKRNLVDTSIVGLDYKGKSISEASGATELIIGTSANLISSQDITINNANGTETKKFILFNDGNIATNAVDPQLDKNTKLTFKNTNCNQIESNSFCSYEVSANSDKSGIEIAKIRYTSNYQTSFYPINVTYFPMAQTPIGILVKTSGSLLNYSFMHHTHMNFMDSVMNVTIKNTGTADLTNLSLNFAPGTNNERYFDIDTQINHGMQCDPLDKFDLLVGEECSVRVTLSSAVIKPTQTEIFNMILKGKSSDGTVENNFSQTLPFAYSIYKNFLWDSI